MGSDVNGHDTTNNIATTEKTGTLATGVEGELYVKQKVIKDKVIDITTLIKNVSRTQNKNAL